MKFSCIIPESRPRIPRLHHSRELVATMKSINSVLPRHLIEVETLAELVEIGYAGAATVCETQGRQVENQETQRLNSPPPWEKKENKIVKLREKVEDFHTYLNTPNPSSKVEKSVCKLASAFRIKRRDPHYKDKILSLNDNLKQKIKALGNRIRRYNDSQKRHKNNRMLFQNQKKFLRSLEQGDESDIYPESKSVEKYWSEIWSENTSHSGP